MPVLCSVCSVWERVCNVALIMPSLSQPVSLNGPPDLALGARQLPATSCLPEHSLRPTGDPVATLGVPACDLGDTAVWLKDSDLHVQGPPCPSQDALP